MYYVTFNIYIYKNKIFFEKEKVEKSIKKTRISQNFRH